MTVPLLLSMLTLLAGPLLFRLSSGSRVAIAGLDGLVRIAVGGLLLLHVLPQAWLEAGWFAFPALVAGMFLPGILDRSLHGHQGKAHRAETTLALAGLGLHAFLDGAALVSSSVLASAVILHRLPVGLAVWWLVRPAFGQRAAVGSLLGMAALTAIGAWSGETVLAYAPATAIGVFQALMAGALLHVVIGHPRQLDLEASSRKEKAVSAVGGILGAAILLIHGKEPLHEESFHGLGETFLALFAESAPALLAAFFTVAFVKAWMPASWAGFFHGGGPFSQALRGTAAGLPVPICSCGVIPMYRGMVEAGTPTPAAMAFLVATPELGWASMILSFGLLGTEMTIVRVLGAGFLALAVGILLGSRTPSRTPNLQPQQSREPFSTRLRNGLVYGFGQLADSTGPWILLGLGIAALMAPVIQADWLTSLPAGADVFAAALIGLPLYVCASGSTPLVAMLLLKGLSPGAALAFLLTGPATNVTTFGVLSHLHGRKIAIAFSVLMPILAIALGFLVNHLVGVGFQKTGIPALQEHAHLSTWANVATIGLAMVYASSLFRLGVPGLLAKIVDPHAEEDAGHQHGQNKEEPSCCEEKLPKDG